MQVAIIIVMLSVFAVAGGVLFYVYMKYLRPGNSRPGMDISDIPQSQGSQGADMSADTKSYLTFKELCHNSINLGMYQYRAIIECSSISYGLRTPQERDMIEYGFQEFLNSLTYPVMFSVQTRTIDNSKAINRMYERGETTVKEHPVLQEYINAYMANMEQLPLIAGIPKCKKKFIIIPYDLESDLSNLTSEEKEQFCRDELANRVAYCQQSLGSIGIKTRLLKDTEIASCLYSAFNRNEYFLVEDIIKGQLSRLSIDGDNLSASLDVPSKVASILFQTRNQIEDTLNGLDPDDTESLALYRGVCNALDVLTREINEGYEYGQDIINHINEMGWKIENERRDA